MIIMINQLSKLNKVGVKLNYLRECQMSNNLAEMYFLETQTDLQRNVLFQRMTEES